jgi:hypothetical protein
MSILVVLTAFGVFVLIVVVWTFRSGSNAPPLSELEKHTQPVDLAILTNLLDPEQEKYLKAKLRRGEFLRYKVMRFSAAHRYISRASRNAAVLVSVGKAAARSADPGIATAGRDLAEAALRLRLYSVVAEVTLALQVVLPPPHRFIRSFFDDYDRMKSSVAQLSNLAVPLQSNAVLRYL